MPPHRQCGAVGRKVMTKRFKLLGQPIVMTYTKDIRDKIESDFGDKASDVFKIFDEAISKTDYLNHNRIIRCILFLAEKNIDKLKKNIQTAEYDPRDVMLWAEYSNKGQTQKPKRIRDFNKTFDECETDVKE
jgi:hypothetical protein